MVKLESQSKRIFLVKFTLKNGEETFIIGYVFKNNP